MFRGSFATSVWFPFRGGGDPPPEPPSPSLSRRCVAVETYTLPPTCCSKMREVFAPGPTYAYVFGGIEGPHECLEVPMRLRGVWFPFRGGGDPPPNPPSLTCPEDVLLWRRILPPTCCSKMRKVFAPGPTYAPLAELAHLIVTRTIC